LFMLRDVSAIASKNIIGEDLDIKLKFLVKG
jgi:hypothetical protein